MAQITVNVTVEDILTGERQNGNRCPIRNALWRNGYHAPKVPWDGEKGVIRITDTETDIRYEWVIPPIAFKWLVRFDRGESVEPFTFRLNTEQAIKKPVNHGTSGKNQPNKQARENRTNQQKGRRPLESW